MKYTVKYSRKQIIGVQAPMAQVDDLVTLLSNMSLKMSLYRSRPIIRPIILCIMIK